MPRLAANFSFLFTEQAFPERFAAARAAAEGIDLPARLAENDACGAFGALGDLVVTGPTRTNVNDFRAILIDPIDNPAQGAR